MVRFRKLMAKTTRRLLSLTVLFGICAMVLPLPLTLSPHKPMEKESSEPFPCQNRPCGCRSAELCWKKCCCFNNSQKIAWAKANQVEVPDYVLAAATKEKAQSLTGREVCSLQNIADRKVTKACPHCQENAPKVAQSAQLSRSESGVSAKSGDDVRSTKLAEEPTTTKHPPRALRLKWMMSVYSAECQGQGPSTFFLSLTIVPERPRIPSPDVVTVEPFAIDSERLQQSSLRPPLPPPKIV